MSFFFGKGGMVRIGTEREMSAPGSIYRAREHSGLQLPPFFTSQK